MVVEGYTAKHSITRRIAQRLATGVTVFDKDPMDGGLQVSHWMQLWQHTHDDWRRTAWPDGRSLIEQAMIAVNLFDIVGAEIIKEATARRAR